MKKAFNIILSVVFLASGLQVSIDRHYCSGTLFATKISLTGLKASCGMEQPGSKCNNQTVFDSKCCEDVMTSFTLNNNFFPEYFQFDKPFPANHVLSFLNIELSENSFLNPGNSNRIFPPGENLQKRLAQSEICVFRI
jgi:hypothetical protein